MAQPSTLNKNQPKNDIWQNLGNSLKNLAQKLWPFLKYEDRAQAVVTLDYNLNYTRPASTFEILFGQPRVYTAQVACLGNKYRSNAINPATGNSYASDFNTRFTQILRGTRLPWLDEDTAKYFDWEYTYVNPLTTLDQVWPGGLILTQSTAPAWSSSTFYAVNVRVSYNGFIWVCASAHINQTPATPSVYWKNTGIPVNTGFTACSIPSSYNIFGFNFYANLAPSNTVPSQYNYTCGSGVWGIYGILNNWNVSNAYQYSGIPGKMPVVTLNTFMKASNSNRYPTPFTVQHQMDMLDFINSTGLGIGTLPKVDHILLGANHFNLGYNVQSSVGCLAYPNGYAYGVEMVNYVSAIRGNSEPITANAKIIIEAPQKVIGSVLPIIGTWNYDQGNLSNASVGFIHAFYNPTNNPTNEDFDIISIRTAAASGPSIWNNSVVGIGTAPVGYFHAMLNVLAITNNDYLDYRNLLTQYGKQNRVKFWINQDRRFDNAGTYNTALQNGGEVATYSWVAGTSQIGGLFVASTNPNIDGWQWGRILDYGGTATGLAYTNTDTFGPNTTRVADYTSVGHMFNILLADRFNPAMGAIRYTRINVVDVSWPNMNANQGAFGIYIESDGSNYSKHTIIILNWLMRDTDFINLDLSQIIDPAWTNVQFQKTYTIGSQYDPVNYFITPGTFIEIQQDTPYTPTAAQISNTQLYPTEYLIITAD